MESMWADEEDLYIKEETSILRRSTKHSIGTQNSLNLSTISPLSAAFDSNYLSSQMIPNTNTINPNVFAFSDQLVSQPQIEDYDIEDKELKISPILDIILKQDQKLEQLKQANVRIQELMQQESPEIHQLSIMLMSVYLELVDDICLETCFEMHKKVKLGLLCVNCDTVASDIINKPGLDIFGQTINDIQTTESFECVNCRRSVMASRYAPHLEKCMGFGRSSSRIATKRLVSAVNKMKSLNESEESDSDRDYNPTEKQKNKKLGKKSRKNIKNGTKEYLSL